MSAADIQAKAFTDNDVAREAIEALIWPNRSSLSALWLRGAKLVKLKASQLARPLLLRRLQKAVHRHGRNHLRAF